MIKELFENVDVIDVKNKGIDTVKGISYHSNRVSQGDLFVCMKGYITDGHRYLKKAVENGAVAAIVEEYVDEVDVAQYRVENSRMALAAVSSKFYGYPSKDLKVTGITATNGKTTTSFMLNSILEVSEKTGVIGTVGVKVDQEMTLAILTTPESLDLQKDLNDIKNAGCSYVTMEVSSSAQELCRAEFIDYDVVTLNNISREHIDNHGSFENYFFHKSKLIRHAKAGTYAILNLDDEYSRSLTDQTEAEVITYGIDNEDGHLTIHSINMSTGFPQFEVEILKPFRGYQHTIEKQKFMVHLNVPGYHSVSNSIVAITAALIYGFSIEQIQKGLSDFKGIERRFEMIYNEDFRVIDDHFANPGNIDMTLKTLQFMPYENLHLLYALRGSRGVTTTKENAEMMVHWLKKLGLDEITMTKSIHHVSKKDKVTDAELDIFLKIMDEGDIKVNIYEDLKESIEDTVDKIKPDDLLLLAGCQGMDYGCNIFLDVMANKKENVDLEKLYKPLETRVAGLLKNLN